MQTTVEGPWPLRWEKAALAASDAETESRGLGLSIPGLEAQIKEDWVLWVV
jgi:hypothetical protein